MLTFFFKTIEYLRQRKDLIPNFLKHLGNASVMDLLLKVIACEDTTDGAGTLEVKFFLD